jgi:hypothetical protein
MITFEKINPAESKIFWNGEQVGWLEKPYGTYYEAELFYDITLRIPANQKHKVVETLKKICINIKGREMRESQILLKLRDSIINKEHKILE